MRIDLRETANILEKSDNILFLCHAHPDGDTLGSATALAHALSAKGKNRYFCLERNNPVPNQPPFPNAYKD